MVRYKTVALNKISAKNKQNVNEVLAPVAYVIENECVGGWYFENMYDMPIFVQPGCLSSLFGGQGSYDHFYMLVFRKED